MELELGVLIAGAISVALGGLAWVQWNISHRHQVRQRDTELLRWGRDCVLLMAELERHCSPVGGKAEKLDQARIETLAWTSSALVDQGRLFFSNVAHTEAPAKSHGLRAFSGAAKSAALVRAAATAVAEIDPGVFQPITSFGLGWRGLIECQAPGKSGHSEVLRVLEQSQVCNCTKRDSSVSCKYLISISKILLRLASLTRALQKIDSKRVFVAAERFSERQGDVRFVL